MTGWPLLTEWERQPASLLLPLPATQHRARTPLSRPHRHQFHQFQPSKQVGARERHDGLPLCEKYVTPTHPAIPCITTCVISELEKLGPKYRIALRVARDPRFERLECSHKGTYADDCIIERIKSHKCYIVATCDRELRRRVRQVPGIPLMYIARRQFRIERLPDQGAPS